MSRLVSSWVIALAMVLVTGASASAQPPRGPGARPAAGDPRTAPGATAGRTASRRARVRREPPPPELTLAVETGDPRPFHVRVRLDAGTEPLVDALVDLRLLTFEVVPVQAPARSRTLRCAYPTVPSRNSPEKLVTNPIPGSVLVDDVVDLRMYCVGAAYEALVGGATVRPVYGYRSASATRYVARATRRGARPMARVEGASVTVASAAVGADLPIRVALPTADARPSGPLALRPYVEGRRPGARAYVRSDLFLFDVSSPSGRTARCEVPRHPVVPILDFFARLAPGRRVQFSIDAARLCPELFREPGIHEVVPIVELVYTGNNVGVDALTGRFRGEGSFVRVRPPAEMLPSELVRPAPASATPGTTSNPTDAM